MSKQQEQGTVSWLSEQLVLARKIIQEIEQQRNAALKLAKELRHQKAHTYASENADLYRGFDNGCEYAGRRIEAILSQKKCK